MDSEMMLFIFEDGTIGQSDKPITDDDKDAIDNGILEVIALRGGRFVSIADDGSEHRIDDSPVKGKGKNACHWSP